MIQTVNTFQQKWQPHKKLSIIDQFKFDQSWENPNMYENGNINGHSIVVETDVYFTKTKFKFPIRIIDQQFPFRISKNHETPLKSLKFAFKTTGLYFSKVRIRQILKFPWFLR